MWRLEVVADIIYVHIVFLFSSYLGLSREKYVNLGGIMDFADIL